MTTVKNNELLITGNDMDESLTIMLNEKSQTKGVHTIYTSLS